jgi:threonine/homoserine/homoserine lactone efflux protein
MAEGISAVLGSAVGVAISPVPIIAVILMLFSRRARINGPTFALGWIVALGVVSVAAYVVADQNGASSSDSTAAQAIAWGKIVFGVLFLLLAVRNWRTRPAPGDAAPMPKWMSGIDDLSPVKALVLGLLLAGVNPKNLMLSLAAGTTLAGLGLPTNEAAWSLVVFVLVASMTIVVPVVYYLVGGSRAKTQLNELKDWLAVNNQAVMAVLFLVIGVDLISKGLPPLS